MEVYIYVIGIIFAFLLSFACGIYYIFIQLGGNNISNALSPVINMNWLDPKIIFTIGAVCEFIGVLTNWTDCQGLEYYGIYVDMNFYYLF